jgi:hypothetical protein
MRSSLLAQLKLFHDRLLAHLDELAAMASADEPDRPTLSQIRWNLSRASRLRKKLIETEILPLLLQEASPADAARLRELQQAITSASASSSRHVSAWTIEQVLNDWAGYRQASAVIRSAMRERIEAERRVLYPALLADTTGGSRRSLGLADD